MNQHLFSIDPIGAIENVKEAAIRYLKWAYHIDNNTLDNQRIDLLSQDGNLFQDPYMEMLPEYAPDLNISDIADIACNHQDIPWMGEFFNFIKKGLMNYPPYRHQVEMLDKAFFSKGNTVITSGTGSGKTESFLLPVLAEIYKEAKGWAPVVQQNPNWFSLKPYAPCQRNGEQRRAAVRAMILYPMNALVEDQMARLRKALDSDSVRVHFDTYLGSNRIYFGRYNGATIGQKSYSILQNYLNQTAFNEKRNFVSEKLDDLHTKFDDILNKWNVLSPAEQQEREEMLYISPRLDGNTATAEMITRWDMQDTPPDIMVTNTSMLSIMLMRNAEKSIFDQTRQWLEESDEHVFQLVVDELHLYRGTAGSEIACLLRMLYRALGLEPVIDDGCGRLIPNPKLRILASSASLGNPADTQKFMEEFFGIYYQRGGNAFTIQEGYPYTPNVANPGRPLMYDSFGSVFTPSFIDLSDTDKRRDADSFAQQFGCTDIETFIDQYQNIIFTDFSNWFGGGARKFDELYDPTIGGLFTNRDAARGFMIFRGYADSIKSNKLPRIRFHQFFKYIEGLWGELNPNPPFISTLSYTSHETGLNGNKMLELLRCESCGELYIGGNRKGNVNATDPYMTLNYPDLSQIPSSNPTPMVQNKSYADYVVFWPTNNGNVSNDSEKHCADFEGSTSFEATHAECGWDHAYLNPCNGKVETVNHGGYIPGWVYRVSPHNRATPDYSKIQALPCQCPHCAQNFIKRKYTKSPIRSFRVGIDRMNQLLSKELIHQLSEKSPKLVGFSDSRNDAARQAFGIELEHYRDMVRKTMLEHVDTIRDLTSGKIEADISDLRMQGLRDRKIENEIIGRYTDVDENFLRSIIDAAFDKIDGQGTQASLNVIFRQIPLDTILPSIEKRLVMLGINPGGVDFSKQTTSNNSHWSILFNFNNGDHTNNGQPHDFQNLSDSLTAAVFANSFGRYMGVSTIDSGMGYIGCKRDQATTDRREFAALKTALGVANDNDVYDFIDSYIRILGDNYRFRSSDFAKNDITGYEDFSVTLKSFVRKYAQDHSLVEAAIGNALYSFLSVTATDNATYLHPNGLAFHPALAGDPYYKCPNCHRIHLTRGIGLCTNTNCMHSLPSKQSGVVDDLWDHFVAHDIKISPRDARRLHTEELTGQTDNTTERLLQFKGIVLEGEEKAKEIDMINVTTTMEVGVDIGSLQAVYQGNMPPTRYNYQQRVGRGGRRGQAFSTAFTFCRGRSHDTYYYLHNLKHMVSAVPPPPTLSLAPFSYIDANGQHVDALKTSIFKRVIVKSIFREAIGNLMPFPDLVDTAGEFGRVYQWNNVKSIVDNWIATNPDTVKDIVNMYMRQFDPTNEMTKMVNWVTNDMLPEIDVKIQGANPDMGLAQCLAERGMLPKYGLPSEVRPFYHRYVRGDEKIHEIDREVEISITEFAPEQEVVKDKGKFVIKALTCPMTANTNRGGVHFNFINPNNNDALSDSYQMTINGNEVIAIDSSHADGENNNQHGGGVHSTVRLVIPQAYRTKWIMNNKGKDIENRDSRTSYSSSLIFANHLPGNAFPPIVFGNVEASIYGTQANNAADIWHVNTNRGKFFYGDYDTPTDRDGNNSVNGSMITDAHGTFFFDQRGGSETIALGSKKATEMICLKIQHQPANVNLNVRTGHKAAILAAFWSAATLIQRCLADKLDVEPEEIEISLKTDQQSGIPMIYLSDSLPNGANLVSHLFENNNLELLLNEIVDGAASTRSFVKNLASKSHMDKCKTSCHDCLNTYSNRGLHHVLDWRLGIGIIRIMLDPTYDFGLTPNAYAYELSDKDSINAICASRLGMPSGQTCDDVRVGRGFGEHIEKRSLWHPLWNVASAASAIVPTGEVNLYDTFSVLRSDLTGMRTVNVNDASSNTPDSPPISPSTKADPLTGIIPDIEL